MAKTNDQTMRLDAELVARGLAPTRSRARDAVLRGHVTVDGRVATKSGLSVRPGAEIACKDPASDYVSRAALKLIAGLDGFEINVSGRTALDIGASTGGFTQVLLERGADHVVALDVGHDQIDGMIAADPRVSVIEGLNARDLTAEHLGGRSIDLLVSDVSFISLKLALPPAIGLAKPGAEGIFLVKPQFEAGRDAIGRGGLLRDPADADRIAAQMAEWLDQQPGWEARGVIPSPIAGGDGNREFLLYGRKARP
ncbi:TlyA family RNA methyltransferase [Jiella marina]|uniref:TlyA family RNA methyltransferase n=1 Tax=Jiella sp. LLJ827 TaxID=2917712 RepID=UPI002100F133|nr:TlyA family RNA methyltransferase [Jiella sp. LLJ827]MCQ0987981.1 TlyA family RNA methyltransferase [Jiella sp. LLJ827]